MMSGDHALVVLIVPTRYRKVGKSDVKCNKKMEFHQEKLTFFFMSLIALLKTLLHRSQYSGKGHSVALCNEWSNC